MAGSYNHMVNDEDGTPVNDSFGYPNLTIEEGGDVVETLEKCYGMIWYMAELLADEISVGLPSRSEILEIITEAQDHIQEGLTRGKSGQ